MWIIRKIYFAFTLIISTCPPTGRKTDERLIRSGELILGLGFVENYQAEPDAMNHGKEGRILGHRRREAVEEFLSLSYDGLAVEEGYARRWAVETAFSTFKRIFREHSLARSMDCIPRELVAKASLYNLLVNIGSGRRRERK